jgi:hypothetical protein
MMTRVLDVLAVCACLLICLMALPVVLLYLAVWVGVAVVFLAVALPVWLMWVWLQRCTQIGV